MENLSHLTPTQAGRARTIWKKLDVDNSNYVTVENLKVALGASDHADSDDPAFFADTTSAARQYMELFDISKDGKIELWEWLAYFDNYAGGKLGNEGGINVDAYLTQFGQCVGV